MNQAPRNPITKPISGLDIANQSGIASLKGSELREDALVRGKPVARPAPKAFGILVITSRGSVIFMLEVIHHHQVAAIARAWDFTMPR